MRLGVTSNPSVILGKDGWLFLANEGSLEDYRHTDPFTPAELESWQNILEARQRWCARSRHRIPRGVRSEQALDLSRGDARHLYAACRSRRAPQLVRYLKERHSPVPVLDLTEPLIEAKSRGVRLYQKTDTHWNDRGAVGGLPEDDGRRAAAGAGRPAFRLSDFEPVTTHPPRHGSGRPAWPEWRASRTEPRPRTPAIPLRLPYVEQDVVEPFTVDARSPPGQPGIVVFRDSFFTQVLPWLAESFGRGAYFWQYGFSPDIIEAEHPAIVIQEIAERKLSLPAKLLDRDHLPVKLTNGNWELVREGDKQ